MIGRSGVTLVELVVALGILGLGTSLALAARWEPPDTEGPSNEESVVSAARKQAVRHGRIVTRRIVTEDRVVEFTVFPDGRVVHDSVTAVVPISGRIDHAAQ